MSKYKKLLLKVLNGTSDANISFNDLCTLLVKLGFEKRTKGSHNIFRKKDVCERINIQKSDSKAKPYQVKEVRKMILNNKLGESDV